MSGGDRGPFRVVSAGPIGETQDVPEISLTFSRPLRRLDASPPTPPVRLRPAVPGTWDWVGTQALRFSPEKPLPMATSFEVEVTGARALDGSTLAEPYTFSFSTPRPRVVGVSPHRNHHQVMPNALVHLQFNQPVDDAAVLASVVIQREGGPTIPYSLRRPSPSDLRHVQLIPRSPLPVHSKFTVRVDEGLRGIEGPLPLGKAYLWDFSTYGPLTASFHCSTDAEGNCRPESWISLQLSNPVRRSDLKKALTIEPPVKLSWPTWDDDKATTSSLFLEGAFLPGRSYTVRLRTQAGNKPLQDIHGQSLSREMQHRFHVGDLPANFNIGISSGILEPSELREIPLFAMNTGRVEVAAVALDLDSVLSLEDTPRPQQVGRIFEHPGARRIFVNPSVGRNRIHRQGIRIEELLPDRRGPVAIAARSADQPAVPERFQLVQVTDLGISAKVGPQESIVWVTRLSSGAPVENALVEVHHPGQTRPVTAVHTDASGIARIPPSTFIQAARSPHPSDEENARSSPLLVVRNGKDWAFHRVSDHLNGWQYGASLETPDSPPTLGLMFTERGLYRPGDTVQVKGMLRQGTTRGMATPAGQKVHVIVMGPEGDKVSEEVVQLSAFGSFAREVKIPYGSKLGVYQIKATLGEKKATSREGMNEEEEGWSPWGTSFTVAEYRPTEFKVSAELDRTSYFRGDRVSCIGQGTYLFGAPMAGATARMDLTHRPTHFMPPGLEGYIVDDNPYRTAHPELTSHGGQLQGGSATLNEQGEAKIEAKLDLPGQQGAELITCESEVTDLSRQAFAGASSAVVHPGEVYAALRISSGYFVQAGATVQPELLAVQPDGKRRAGVNGTITLLERTYGVVRQSAAGGRIHTSNTITDREVSTCRVTTGVAPTTCELHVPQGGHYLVRATVTDGRGNQVSASQHLYALGSGGGGWQDQDNGAIHLVTDKKTYRAGETAKILVPSPFPKAEALVTVEREGILWQKAMTLSGGTPTVEIPVTEAFLPNAFVSVLLLRGRTKRTPEKDNLPDVGAPTFRMGYVPIVVDTSSRRLNVEIKPDRRELHPGDEVNVEVNVQDAGGKGARAEVTLYAVDEGVLSLTGYRTPDPVEVFFAPRGVQVRTLESRDALARIARTDSGVALGLDKGLEGGDGGSAPRRDFRQTAYFNPGLMTNEAGRARISFKLPEGLSTYRIMAIAATQGDRFGSADTQVITSKPLMARPALPRVLRVDDRFEAGVVVTSKGASGRFEVTMTAEGLTTEGVSRRSLDLHPGQSQEVRFPAVAPRAGKVKLRFDVRGEGSSDSVEVTREVITPTILEATALYGDTTEAAGERLGDLAMVREDVGGLEVSLSPTALAGLAGGVEQLVEYPYGCTEQLTSRLVPLLPLRDLAATFGLRLPERVDDAVQITVGKLLNHQHSDGGFGLWRESTETYPWLTAYALWGLGEAHRRGFSVRASALNAATRYLRASLQAPANRIDDLAQRAFVLDVLAENGEPDAGAMTRLFEEREKLPLFAKAQLLHALAVAHAEEKLLRVLTGELESSLRIDGPHATVVVPETDEFSWLLDSSTRTSALVLRALVAARPDHPQAARLATGLLTRRRGGRWRSTQETAWALLALDAYRRAQEAAIPAFQARVFLGQALLTETTFQGRERLAFQSTIPMSALHSASGSVLAFAKQGDGRLFYEARLRFARRKLPALPIESGFFIDKGSQVVTPESMQAALRSQPRGAVSSLNAGDLVLVNLSVVAPSERTFVVIDDPLPAGLEPVDTSLRGVASWQQERQEYDIVPIEDDQPEAWRWESSVTRRELRDDRVLFFIDRMAPGIHHFRYLARATTLGTFVAPPTRVEEMYTPETFGQTAAATLTITARP
ncbi:MAG: MG2 domain-containing protein [Myxococcales bacterium]|nr:MG2 domain-containing protein [Polyangiaceae bacterium]MDW8249524.1 MG2 domain-containing protein [Myxococcales bacterium]